MVVVVAAVLLVAVTAGLVRLGETGVARTRAQSAADAAALASLDGGRPAAEALASANGASVVSWRRGPGRHEVTVVVEFDGVSATARATDAP